MTRHPGRFQHLFVAKSAVSWYASSWSAPRKHLTHRQFCRFRRALPGWARIDAPLADTGTDAGAAFQAGAALAMLDCRVRADVPFAGVWRRRLALKAAAASARIARRGEDEATLRDVFFLRRGGDDPGPAGRMLVAWRGLDRSAPLSDDSRLPRRRNPAAQNGRRRCAPRSPTCNSSPPRSRPHPLRPRRPRASWRSSPAPRFWRCGSPTRCWRPVSNGRGRCR